MKTVIVTTINPPTAAVLEIARGARENDWHFIIIGDRKSPATYDLPDADYFDIAAQSRLPHRFAQIVPMGHYARKNIGYLIAIENQAELIAETDDDNIPRAGFWDARSLSHDVSVVDGEGWVNIYKYFTDDLIWPRGLPLNTIAASRNAVARPPVRAIDCPIQQGLADENPDVDAIYRLILPLPFNFADRPAVAMAGRACCPFNSQNTSWYPQAYPLLYLPFHCSFRMTDIWRSFVAQRIAQENGWGVLFHNATMYQERNAHDLMKDFADEVVGYTQNAKIMERLLDLPLSGKPSAVLDDLALCYDQLIQMGVVGSAERPLLDAWRADVERIGGWIG